MDPANRAFQGDVGITGVTVENIGGDGIVFSGNVVPSVLNGQIRGEQISGRGLVVDDGQVTIAGALNIRTTAEPVIHVRAHSHLVIFGHVYVDTYEKPPEVLVDRGASFSIHGDLRSYDGREVKWRTAFWTRVRRFASV